MAKGQYPLAVKDNVVPLCDMAGEVAAVGEDVRGWTVGERVSASLALDYIFGDLTPEIIRSLLGSEHDGVLTEYRAFPAHVRLTHPAHAVRFPC